MNKIIAFLILLFSTSAFAETGKGAATTWVTGVKESDGTAITVSAATYTAKDVVGQLMKFPSPPCKGKKGKLGSVLITDKDGNAVEYTLHIFSKKPTGTYTTHVTMTVPDISLDYLTSYVNNSSRDCRLFADNGYCFLSSINQGFQSLVSGTSKPAVYGVLQTAETGTQPTYSGTDSIVVKMEMICE